MNSFLTLEEYLSRISSKISLQILISFLLFTSMSVHSSTPKSVICSLAAAYVVTATSQQKLIINANLLANRFSKIVAAKHDA